MVAPCASWQIIREVKPLPGKRLRLTLTTGSILELNMGNRLNTVRFCPLREDRIFNSVTTDGFYLHFAVEPNYELDFTLREAILMAVNEPPEMYHGFDPFQKEE